MKNEDRIVELLVEMLRKQDRHEEIIHSQSEILKSHSELLKELVKGQQELVESQNKLVKGCKLPLKPNCLEVE